MSTLCKQLFLFIDGELPEAQADQLRDHLAYCTPCATQFHEAVQLELLARSAFPPEAVVPRPMRSPPDAKPLPLARPRHASWGSAVWVLATAATLAVLAYVGLATSAPSPRLWLAEAPTRSIEARLSFSLLNRYRPYEPTRSASASVQAIPLAEFSRLSDKLDALAIAAAYLVHGEVKQAQRTLEAAPSSPNRDNDLAVIAMLEGNLPEALRLLEQALRASPDHLQALWNHALVLRDLGETRRAAEAFARIAALGEPGWCEEAKRNARALRES